LFHFHFVCVPDSWITYLFMYRFFAVVIHVSTMRHRLALIMVWFVIPSGCQRGTVCSTQHAQNVWQSGPLILMKYR